MPLRTPPLDEPSMNLTAMLDVVLNILLFYMLASVFPKDERQYDVELPSVPAAEALAGRPDDMVINVHSDGGITVGGQALSLSELETLLRDARTRYPDQSVLIRGDGHSYYQPIMDVMAACHIAGIRHLAMANKPATRR